MGFLYTSQKYCAFAKHTWALSLNFAILQNFHFSLLQIVIAHIITCKCMYMTVTLFCEMGFYEAS